MLNNKSILVTGGTGSFGQKFTETVLQRYSKIKRLVIYSRDELKQFEMAQEFSPNKYKGIRYFLGDVRDRYRFLRACNNIDIIIHAAALKQVPAAEYNPMEFIKTNINGAENIIESVLDSNVEKVIALSTDKAAAPVNLYGATKLVSDKLFVAANNYGGKNNAKFSVVRYGNVLGSRGSVVPFFKKMKKEDIIPITDTKMTRFNITLQECVEFVLKSLDRMCGGEIFVPKIPSYKITDIAKAIAPNCKIKIVGIRAGEKLHEEMITITDALRTVEFNDYFVILPATPMKDEVKFINESSSEKGKLCKHGFSYNSETNENFLTIQQLKKLINDFA
jgi:UDP-N-acetylglucosamine 4,6-dehydratase (inverting)